MAISATQIATSNTLENFRQQYNNLQTDVNGLESGTLTFSTVSATTTSTSALNILEDGTIVFEGATDDAFETTLTVTDPTADRTITLPNATGTVLLSGGSSLTVADDGTIGSASDTDAIAISSAGVVTFSATTESSSASNGAVIISGGLGVAKDVSVGDDLRLISDSSVLSFGADSDVTVTHDADDGLVLKSTATGDDNPFLLTLQTGETDIAANDKLGVIDFQAPDEGTGTDAILVAAGIEAISEGDFSSSSNATKLSFKTASSEAAAEKMSLSSAGLLTVSGRIITDDTTEATSTTDGSLQTDGGLSVAKDAVIGDDLLLLSDSAVLKFGADSDTTFTHTDGTGLTLNSTNKLTFGDAASFVQQSSDGVLRIDGEATIDLNASTAVSVSNDLKLESDGAVLTFGADSEITVTHVADSGLTLKHAASGDDKFPLLSLAAGDNDIAANDVLGRIAFIAPDEGAGTDAILNAGVIDVFSEGNFSASNNAASMRFVTGNSAAAGTDGGSLILGSTGNLTLKDLRTADGSSPTITLQSGDTDIAANDVLGTIDFQAPDEGTGTDAILVAAGIAAVSEGDFSSSSNATKLSFKTAASAAAAETMALSSGGNLTVSGTIVPTGAITANAGVVVDNITIDGTEIDLSSGDLTLDVAGDIILDVAGEEVIFKDGSTNVGHASLDSDNFTLKSLVSDKDFIVQGNDGGTGITALTLDMSAAGAATFNNDVTAFSDERLKTDIETITDGLEKLMKLRGVTYKRNDVEDAKLQMGVIAQEVEKVVPEVVLTADDEVGTKSVDYGKLTALLIESVKELGQVVNNEIQDLKKEIATMNAINDFNRKT